MCLLCKHKRIQFKNKKYNNVAIINYVSHLSRYCTNQTTTAQLGTYSFVQAF